MTKDRFDRLVGLLKAGERKLHSRVKVAIPKKEKQPVMVQAPITFEETKKNTISEDKMIAMEQFIKAFMN